MFALIIILLQGPVDDIQIMASNLGTFDSFQECFAARESFTATVFGMREGYYPPNSQAVCIRLAVQQEL